jgi:hypothetical protein
LSFFIDSYSTIAEFKSVVDRLTGFQASTNSARALGSTQPHIDVAYGHSPDLDFENLEVALPKGGNVVRIKEQEVDNLKRQTKVISGMSPEGAVAMLNEMPDDDLVKILFTLKPDSVSEILDAFSKMGKPEAKRAAALSERLRLVLPPPPTNSRPSSPG